MRRYLQYEPFNIYCFEAEAWQHPVHKHNHFEMIFIRHGEGKHVVNHNAFAYATGDVFLLGPEDYHYFEITIPTQFCFIRFMEVFVKDETSKNSGWQQTLEFLLHTPYQACGSMVQEDEEKQILAHLLQVLLQEYDRQRDTSYEVIMHSVMQAILGVLARNIIKQPHGKDAKVSSPVESLMVFIRQHIFHPECLRVEYLAEEFHYSASYLSAFFKKHTGESLQQYILKYKLKLIETRLQYSHLSISQIAHEFGFTDESHLNKTFRKYYGIPPGAFRNKVQLRPSRF